MKVNILFLLSRFSAFRGNFGLSENESQYQVAGEACEDSERGRPAR
jgi:hypothetical protein